MTIIYFLIVLGILVFVHEFGHFIMAKMAGVRVEKFSLGMGPKLIGYKKGDTEYLISALPLGGYVKMAGENPDEEPTGAADEFQSKTVWQRVKIAATGPLTNIVLAFIVMPVVFMTGVPVEGPAKVHYVEKNSPAERAGFRAGDIIEEINGRRINDWTKAFSLIAVNPDTDLNVIIERQGGKETLTLRPKAATELKIGVSGLVPDQFVEIIKVTPKYPAEQAGLASQDRILAVDGVTVYHFEQFVQLVNVSKGKPIRLSVERKGKRIEKMTTPIKRGEKYVIGVEIQMIVSRVVKKYGLFESMKRGAEKTLEMVDLTFITLKKLLTFSLSIKTLGGPVMIAQLSGQAAAMGLSAFLGLLAMVSISLGILNLLPIPILDGGMILFLVIEAIRKKPLSRRTMEIAQSIGAAVLITLIAVVSYNDVMRAFFSK